MAQKTRGGLSRQWDSSAVSASAIRLQLERILASRSFSRSQRLSRFLRFTVEQVLEGRSDQIKEYLLGVEVFDRKASFDSRVDPIVRVEARRLRSKLKAYYENDGRNDEIAIEYPTGSYVPEFRRRGLPAAGPRTTPSGFFSADDAKSIVVLPFVNLSLEPEGEYFSDGLTEELIHALTKLERLRVVAWNSAFQLKGKPYDLRKLGEQLHVGSVLEGSVRRSGDRLRITAQLVRVATGEYLWSETYERRLRDVFAIQDEISRAIVSTLRLRLIGPATRLVKDYSENLEAYHLYLRGRFHSNRRTEAGFKKSIECFEEAISRDPDYAPAHAGLADTYSLLAEYGVLCPAEVMPKARAAALRALEIDDTLSEVHTSLGFVISLYDWDWAAAEHHYRCAIALNPSYTTARCWYASAYLAPLGRLEEATGEIQRALELDPLSLIALSVSGNILIAQRRYEEASEQFRKVIELDPAFYRGYSGLARVCVQLGDYEEGVELLRKAKSLSGDLAYVTGRLGYCCGVAGIQGEARRLRQELLELSGRRFVPAASLALIHIGLGEVDAALDWLEKAFEQRDASLIYLKVHTAYKSLLSEERFSALLRRIGLDE